MDNSAEWGFLLLAYLSLVREMAKGSLTEGLVRERASTFRWMQSVGFFFDLWPLVKPSIASAALERLQVDGLAQRSRGGQM